MFYQGDEYSVKGSRRCKKCKGEKVVKEKTRQEVRIERGMSDGQRIVLAGAGDQEVSDCVLSVSAA